MPSNPNSHSTFDKEQSRVFQNKIISEFATEEEFQIFENNMKCISYKKGDAIVHEHQPVYLIYFINRGKVKLWKEGIHNHQQIVHFAKTGDIFGYWGCLSKNEYTLSATAMEDSSICFIKSEIFFSTMNSNIKMHFELLKHYTENLKNTEVHLRNMADMNVREKVAYSLLQLLDVFGMKENSNVLDVEVTRFDISSLSGVSMDRVSKQFTEFKENSIIHTVGKETSVDEKLLKEIISAYIFLD